VRWNFVYAVKVDVGRSEKRETRPRTHTLTHIEVGICTIGGVVCVRLDCQQIIQPRDALDDCKPVEHVVSKVA